jgi:Uma2 family endonuclease
VRFYYPDVSVICRPNPQEDSFQDEPVVVVEVLSRETRRTDEGEKKDTYLTIPSLSAYLMIEQAFPSLVAFRRTEQGFFGQTYEGSGAVVPLEEVDAELRLDEVYAGVEFPS